MEKYYIILLDAAPHATNSSNNTLEITTSWFLTFGFVLRPIYKIRKVVCDYYPGLCDRINTRKNITFQIWPWTNE